MRPLRSVAAFLIFSLVTQPLGTAAFAAKPAKGAKTSWTDRVEGLNKEVYELRAKLRYLLEHAGPTCSPKYFSVSPCPSAFTLTAKQQLEQRASKMAQAGQIIAAARAPAAQAGVPISADAVGNANACEGALESLEKDTAARLPPLKALKEQLTKGKAVVQAEHDAIFQTPKNFASTVAACAAEVGAPASMLPKTSYQGAKAIFEKPMFCFSCNCLGSEINVFYEYAGTSGNSGGKIREVLDELSQAEDAVEEEIKSIEKYTKLLAERRSTCGNAVAAAKENPAAKDPSKSDVNPKPEGGKTRGLVVGEKADPKAAAAGGEAPEVEAKKGDAKPGEGDIKPKVVKTEPVKGTDADQAAAAANAGSDLTKNPSDPAAVKNNTVKGNAAEAAKSVLPTNADGVSDVSMPEDRPYKERDITKANETIAAEVEEGKANFAKEKADAARLNASTAPAQETLIASPEDRGAGERDLADPPRAIAAEVKARQDNLPKQQELDKQIQADAATQRTEEWKAWEQHRSGDDHQLQTPRTLPADAEGAATAAAGSFTNQPLAPYQEKPFTGPAPADDRLDLSGSGRPGPDRTKRQPASSDDLNDHVSPDWNPDSSGGTEWGVAQPVTDKAKDSSFPTGPVMLGVAALAAGGVAAGVLLSRKKKGSSSGVTLAQPAPAPTATATATETSTSTSTATSTVTSSGTSTATATGTGSGGGGYFPGTSTATATATLSSTATRTSVNTQTSTSTGNSGSALMPGSFYPGTQVMVPVPISKGK